jgi:hypothetical protein
VRPTVRGVRAVWTNLWAHQSFSKCESTSGYITKAGKQSGPGNFDLVGGFKDEIYTHITKFNRVLAPGSFNLVGGGFKKMRFILTSPNTIIWLRG